MEEGSQKNSARDRGHEIYRQLMQGVDKAKKQKLIRQNSGNNFDLDQHQSPKIKPSYESPV